jgi:SAM-dependent methyltransferase
LTNDPAFTDRQRAMWDRTAQTYVDEIDRRFAPVIDHVIELAHLQPGERVLDLGTGTGSVAMRAAALVAPGGSVTGIDLSPGMLLQAEARAEAAGVAGIHFREGSATAIPAADASADVLTASLCMMFVPDRATAAQECARVLRPGGRFVAAVWGGPDVCDLNLLLGFAARFSARPPMPGVGGASLADPAPFMEQLAVAGIDTRVDACQSDFEMEDFETAWRIFGHVVAAGIPDDRIDEAKAAVCAEMWPIPTAPRLFANTALFVTGTRRA